MKVIVSIANDRKPYEVCDMNATGATMGAFDSVGLAKSAINGFVLDDIQSCRNSDYAVISTITGEIVYEYQSDNSDSFTVENLRAEIIRLLRGEINTTITGEFMGAPNQHILNHVAELSTILASRLHPELF